MKRTWMSRTIWSWSVQAGPQALRENGKNGRTWLNIALLNWKTVLKHVGENRSTTKNMKKQLNCYVFLSLLYEFPS